jgi:hypothetical protein
MSTGKEWKLLLALSSGERGAGGYSKKKIRRP